MFSVIRKSSLLALCVMLCSCVSYEEIIKKDSASIDLSALEKFGKRVEKYDFAPHQAVFDVTGSGIVDNGPNVGQSLYESCKRAGGVYNSSFEAEQYMRRVDTVFAKIYLYKMGRNSAEKLSNGYRCKLPSEKGVIEITTTSFWENKKKFVFAVIQEDGDINATKLLIAQMEEEVKNMLQSSIDEWQSTSETLRNDLKPGSTVYFVSANPSKRGWVVQEGMVVEVKAPLAFVQFQNDKQWIKIEELNAKVPGVLFCDNKEMLNAVGGRFSVERYKGSCFEKK